MSYDPYNDPDNPVDRGKQGAGPTLAGNGGGNFEYGPGGRDITINPADDGVAGGFTEVQRVVANWDRESGNDADADDSVSRAEHGGNA